MKSRKMLKAEGKTLNAERRRPKNAERRTLNAEGPKTPKTLNAER